MRSSLIAAVSALALLAGPTLAQTSPPTGGATTTPGAPAAGGAVVAPRTPAPNPFTLEDISAIKGSTVYGSDDKKIGDVSTVLMKPDSKTIDRLVVAEGGLLGVGSHRVALPIDDFKWDGQKEAFKISKTADELKAMPEWKSAASASSSIPSSSSVPSSGSSKPPSDATGAPKTEAPKTTE
jgi:sporulation protein YlmC with PRC-barrel domain